MLGLVPRHQPTKYKNIIENGITDKIKEFLMKFITTSTKKYINMAFLGCLSASVLTACGTTALSHDISQEGRVDASNIVWPELDDAWQKDGQFPNSEDLSKIKAGIAKDELYKLIGRPHFSERQHAREWDYIMKFYQPDDSVKICQYKVIFDENMKGQEFYWLPADCPPKKKVAKDAPVVVPTRTVTNKKITLDADALFKFDKYKLGDMLPAGRVKLNKLAEQLKGYSKEGDVRIHIIGHTDRKGSDQYNMILSQNRANTVLAYLANNGIRPASMTATGLGENYPVANCPMNLSAQQEIKCLQPNRRVEVDVAIHNYK